MIDIQAWWLELMQIRTPAEQLLHLWADWALTVQQAALRPLENN